MKQEIKLFVKFQFTSLSSDAQPISLGIVSEDKTTLSESKLKENEIARRNGEIRGYHELPENYFKSFYAEFSDFDINRCDDWVKENVVKKLQFYPESHDGCTEYCLEYWDMCKDTKGVIIKLQKWLEQFSGYNIQFVVDCGTFNWYWMLQLLAEWEGKYTDQEEDGYFEKVRTGLPKLPDNISPVPEDLNDLIAHKKGISVREAFELKREELVDCRFTCLKCNGTEKEYYSGFDKLVSCWCTILPLEAIHGHNALWDAKVIKEVYGKLALNENVYDTKTIDLRWINEMEDYEFAKFIDYMKELGLVVDNSKLEFSYVPKLKE